MSLLAAKLALTLERPVIDETNIAGRYDIFLTWTPDNPNSQSSVDAGPSLFTALQEQLGLKLESHKRPIDVLVIDHIEPPSAN